LEVSPRELVPCVPIPPEEGSEVIRRDRGREFVSPLPLPRVAKGGSRVHEELINPPDIGFAAATPVQRRELEVNRLNARGPTCPFQLDSCSVLLEIEYLAVVVHANADSGPHEGVWSLECQSLAFVAHENIRDPRVIVLHSHLAAGGVELQHPPVAEVIWIEDFP